MDDTKSFKFVFGLDTESPVPSIDVSAETVDQAWAKVIRLVPKAREYIKHIDVANVA